MKYAHYDTDGNIIGFYDSQIHGGSIPNPILPIDDTTWLDSLFNHGKYIVSGGTIIQNPNWPPLPGQVYEGIAWRNKTAQEIDNEKTVKADFEAGLDDMLRCFALVVLDEINILRQQHGLAIRTAAQLKAAIKAKLP